MNVQDSHPLMILRCSLLGKEDFGLEAIVEFSVSDCKDDPVKY